MNFNQVTLKTRFSYSLCFIVIVLSIVSFFVILYLPMMNVLKFVLITILLALTFHLFKQPSIWLQIVNGRWFLLDKQGNRCEYQLCRDLYVSRWLIILSLRAKTSGKCRRLCFYRDSLTADEFRRLRVGSQNK